MGGGHDSDLIVIGGDLAAATRFLGCRSADLLKRVWAAAPIGEQFRSWLPVRSELEALINTPADRLGEACDDENAARMVAMGELLAFTRPDLPASTTAAGCLREGKHFVWEFIRGTGNSSPFPEYNNEENVWVQVVSRNDVSRWVASLDAHIAAAASDSAIKPQVIDAQLLRDLVAGLQAYACDVAIIHSCPP